jgi:hypothetical protein
MISRRSAVLSGLAAGLAGLEARAETRPLVIMVSYAG